MIVLAVVCAVLGLVIGSFLNVVIHRVPRDESIVRPPSACPGCGAAIAPRDNVPVISWLLLRGRCRHCREPISGRYPRVELLTGVLFAVMATRFGLGAELPAFLYLAAIAVALAYIDIDVHRLPDVIVLPSYPVLAVLLALAAWGTGDWWALVRALGGGAALWGFYGVLWLAYPRGMGLGDVKLAGVLGMGLGWLGWPEVVVGGFAAFLLGGVVGVALIATGRAGGKSAIPFGPYMLVGALVALLATGPLVSWYVDLVGLST